MILATELWELVRAGFSGIWIETLEASEAIVEITELAREQNLGLWRWNLDLGLVGPNGEQDVSVGRDPLSVIRWLQTIDDQRSTLLILEGIHHFVSSVEIVQALQTQLLLGKQCGRHIVILSPVVKLPAEIERQFVVVNHPLPTKEQLRAIAESLVSEDTSAMLTGRAEELIDAACGLTRAEAESAFSLSLVRHGHLATEEIWHMKASLLRKNGLLSMHRGERGFDSLGGLENLKQFCLCALRHKGDETHRSVKARGLMLLGVPGTGKSGFAKSLGKETGRPVLCLDIGGLLGSLIGQSENNIRQALQTVDAMAPCVLFIDEIEKALAGASSGRGDSGVSSRLFGTLLTWLNDHESDVFTIVTCNDIRRLPPEFSRAERFDAIMFLDLPGPSERESIWTICRSEFEIDASDPSPIDNTWTGAEIRSCCRLSKLLGITLRDASKYIVPVASTAAEGIAELQRWATGRCLDASRPGVYRGSTSGKEANTAQRPSRRVQNCRPSDN